MTILILTLHLFMRLETAGAKPSGTVYICQGSASYAYHATMTCEGLAWCSTSAKRLSKTAALKLGRRPCGRCYR